MKKRLFIVPLLILFVVGMLATFAESAEVPRMPKDELKAMLGDPGLVLLDVRFGNDWTGNSSKIKGAIREDPGSPKSWAEKYSKDKTIVLYCS